MHLASFTSHAKSLSVQAFRQWVSHLVLVASKPVCLREVDTAESSEPPGEPPGNMEPWSHFSRTKMEPRLVPWW